MKGWLVLPLAVVLSGLALALVRPPDRKRDATQPTDDRQPDKPAGRRDEDADDPATRQPAIPRSHSQPRPVTAFEPQPAAPEPRRRASRKLPPASALNDGQFRFRDDILDQLEIYMHYIKRMKRGDPEAYKLYSKIGAHIVPRQADWDGVELSPWWLQTMPSFGAISYTTTATLEEEKETKSLYPRFMYFRKYSHQPPDIEYAKGGAVYAVTAYWDDKKDFKHGVPTEFPVLVCPNGSVRLLRANLRKSQTIRHRRGTYRGTDTTITCQRWGVHEWFLSWAGQHKMNVQEHLTKLFIGAANGFEMMNSSMIRVSAEKDGLIAAFGVDVTYTSHFFADRDVDLTIDNKKQRIFHLARVHPRTLADGRVVPVKTHFRGLREFRWNGYDVRITVPHLDHLDIASFNGGVVDEDSPFAMTHRDELVRIEEFADVMANVVRGRPPPRETGDGVEQRGLTP